MFSKITYISFIILFVSLSLSSCIEQAVKYNNEPENESVFVGSSDKNIYSLDAHTGTKKWAIEVNSGIIHGPILVDSIMYIVCADQNMYAYNYLKKTKKWTSLVGNVANLSYLNGLLYIRNTDKKFKAFDTNSGIKIWESGIYDGADSIPAIGADVVLIRTAKDVLQAFDAQGGMKKWDKKLSNDIKANPFTADGVSFFTNDSLYAVENGSGKRKWAYFVGNKQGTGGKFAITISKTNVISKYANLLYFADETNEILTAIRADSGFVKRSFPIKNITKLYTTNSTIYALTTGGGLVAIDSSMRLQKWTLTGDVKLTNDPNIISGIIFAGSSNKTFFAIDGKTGIQKWTFPTTDNISALSTFANDIVFISSQDGSVNAIEAETGKVKWSFKTSGKVYSKPVVLTTDRKVF